MDGDRRAGRDKGCSNIAPTSLAFVERVGIAALDDISVFILDDTDARDPKIIRNRQHDLVTEVPLMVDRSTRCVLSWDIVAERTSEAM